jgi:tripartite-type tricarboxylate transporter receptor subunit TctC
LHQRTKQQWNRFKKVAESVRTIEYPSKEKEPIMKNHLRSLLLVGLFLAISGLGAGVTTTFAQTYPDRPIQLVVPGAAGSILDIAGRIVADEMGKILGQQVVVVTKPGAGFTLGTDAVARSKKDGYTLAYTNSPAIIYSRIINPETVPYDPDKDLEPLGLHLFISTGIAVQANAPWKDFSELVDYAKKNPNKVRVSTPGVGSSTHFQLEVVQALTGAQFAHVPFKGGESVITAVLGGHVEMTFDAVNKLTPHVEGGKMRILLLTKKMADLPQIPTLRDSGYNQDLVSDWFGMYGPSGLPEEVRKVLIPAIEKAMKNPEGKAKLEKLGFAVDYKSAAELKRIATADYETNLAIAKKLGLRK